MSSTKRHDHSGSTFDSFLEEEGVLAESEAVAIKRLIAWQIEQAMANKKISKNAMAKRLCTSRTQIDRLLDPSHVGISIETVARAAKVVGKRVTFQIVDEKVVRRAAPKKESSMAARGRSIKPAKAGHKSIA
jgi:plasmid maintenance system antidote protein VapI